MYRILSVTAVALGLSFGWSLPVGAQPDAENSPAESAAASASEGDAESAATEAVEVSIESAEEPKSDVKIGRDTRASTMRAYQAALKKRRLGTSAKLNRQLLQESISRVEQHLNSGRTDEAVGDLVYLIEDKRFEPFAKFDEGRAALFLLGDTLGRSGALGPARGYLLPLLTSKKLDTWYRRAVRSLVDLGLATDHGAMMLDDLKGVPGDAPKELTGDVAYLAGRVAEAGGDEKRALKRYASVSLVSRFWAQATYRSALIRVAKKQFKQGEQLFCKVADPKKTPKLAPLYGGTKFFQIRDLSRLGLGRVAHEQYRFGDSRYYYYLVPADSERFPEALYESATSRYEAKDYRGARDLLDELTAFEDHVYADEVQVFAAYLDLAMCEFPAADKKLRGFIEEYEPARDAARKLAKDPGALRELVEAIRASTDPAEAGTGLSAAEARALGGLLRVEADYSKKAQRLAQLDHQLSGLRRSMTELDDVGRRLATPKELRPRSDEALAGSELERLDVASAQLREVRSLLRALEQNQTAANKKKTSELRTALAKLETRQRNLKSHVQAAATKSGAKGKDLPALVGQDRARASALYAEGRQLRRQLILDQETLAREALGRLDLRLSRLLRRARLGRIETVLGKKRALEVEIDALSQGFLPRGAVDSLDAARYLQPDEEYWPFDGEDWADEYVGGEGLR